MKVVALSGSARADAWCRVVLDVAAAGAAAKGATVTRVDLSTYALPIFEDDGPTGGPMLPVAASRFADLMASADGLLIGAPECQAMPAPGVVNALAWLGRAEEMRAKQGGRKILTGKPVGLVSASAGTSAGLRGLAALGGMLGELGTVIVPSPVGVSGIAWMLDAQGDFKDKNLSARIAALGGELVNLIKRFGGSNHAS